MTLNTIKALLILNAKKGTTGAKNPKVKGWTDAARLKAAATRKAKKKVAETKAPKKSPTAEPVKKGSKSKVAAKAVIQKAKKTSMYGQTEVSGKSKIEAKNATSTHAVRKQHHDKMTKKGFKLTSSHPNDGDVYKKRVGDNYVSVHVTPIATTGKGNLKYKGVSITSSTLKDAYTKHGYQESDKPAAKLADKTGE